MKHIEINELVNAVPLNDSKQLRNDRLQHWADLVRMQAYTLELYSDLEHWFPHELRAIRVKDTMTPFAIAAASPIFQQQGLTDNPSVAEIMAFFDLSQPQLHEFSCDCGGGISNREMADRIEKLAA